MVIGPNGEKMGIKKLSDALTLAGYAGLDLVLMNQGNGVAVTKIMDYNKFKYEKNRKNKEKRVKKLKNIVYQLQLMLVILKLVVEMQKTI